MTADIDGAGEDFCYLTTTGRRTGNAHTIEIWFGLSGRTVYILTFPSSDTVRNARVTPDVGVRIGERRYRATARTVEPGSDEDAMARKLLVAKYQAPGATDLESWGRTALPVAFDVTGPDGS